MNAAATISLPPEMRTVPTPVPSPAKSAGALAGAYVVLGSAYILFSTRIAASMSLSVDEMETVEKWKGNIFIAVTATLLFFMSYFFLKRIRRQAEIIARQLHALHNSERAMLAGTFAGSIAHDVNNALTVCQLSVEALRAEIGTNKDVQPMVEDLSKSLAAVGDWNRRLFDLGCRRKLGEKKTIDICLVVTTCVTLARRLEQLHDRSLSVVVPTTPVLTRGSEHFLRRAVLNLVINAAEAAGKGGKIAIEMDVRSADEFVIRVDDSGPGIPKELRSKVLEPFFTTKKDGSGMGLASVVACAELHDGRVEILDSPLGGARFELHLRRVTEESEVLMPA